MKLRFSLPILFSALFAFDAASQTQDLALCSRTQAQLSGIPMPEECSLPSVGESHTYNASRYNTGMSEGGAYRLVRLPDQNGNRNIEISLNLQFRAEKKADAELVREKVKKCFARAKDWMKSTEGDHISLRLSNEDENADNLFDALIHPSKLSAETIRVDNRCEIRENSRCYSTETSCQTILHETFHLLGLVDEYEESWKGYYTDDKGEIRYAAHMPAQSKNKFSEYDCRALGPKDSIMRNTSEAVDKFLVECESLNCTYMPLQPDRPAPQALLDQIRTAMSEHPPQCPVGRTSDYLISKDRSTGKANIDQTTCPSSSERTFDVYSNSTDGKPQHWDQISFSSNLREIKPDPKQSLLYPAQLYRILYPGCEILNHTYLKCSENAYRTSKAHHGEGCKEPVPAECKSEKWVM